MTEPAFVMLGVAWDLGENTARIHLNDTTIASVAAAEVVASTYAVPKLDPLKPEDLQDFSRESATAKIAREGRVKGTGTQHGKLPGTKGTVLQSLRDEAAQIESLIGLLDKGALFHARGLANSIGLMIADGNRVPLVQLAATMAGGSLTVFTVARPHIRVPLSPNASVSIDIAAEPSRLYPNPIDLDAWLSLEAAMLDGRSFTNSQVIKSIRNTTGSHSDRDLHPLVEMLRSTKSAAAGGTEHDLLVVYVRQVAVVALSLAHDILRKAST